MEEKFVEKSFVLIDNTGFTLKLIQKDPQNLNSEERKSRDFCCEQI